MSVSDLCFGRQHDTEVGKKDEFELSSTSCGNIFQLKVTDQVE